MFLAPLRQKSSNVELRSRSNLMACDNRTKVYLGYEDEYVTEKHRSSLNFQTNKIGGHPVSKREALTLFSRKILPSHSLCHSARLLGNSRSDFVQGEKRVKEKFFKH